MIDRIIRLFRCAQFMGLFLILAIGLTIFIPLAIAAAPFVAEIAYVFASIFIEQPWRIALFIAVCIALSLALWIAYLNSGGSVERVRRGRRLTDLSKSRRSLPRRTPGTFPPSKSPTRPRR